MATSTPQRIETLARDHRAFLHARLRRLGVPEADLEDAVQDVLAVLIRRIDAVDPARPARPWLSGVARRIAPKYRSQARSSQPLVEEHTAVRPGQESRMVLSQLLRRLDGPDLELFLLMDVQGLSAREAGERLELNPNTVAYRIRRARKELDRIVARDRLRDAVRVPALVPWPLAASVTAVILGCVGVAAVRGCDRDRSVTSAHKRTEGVQASTPAQLQREPSSIEPVYSDREFPLDGDQDDGPPYISLGKSSVIDGARSPDPSAPAERTLTTQTSYRIVDQQIEVRARFTTDRSAQMRLAVDAATLEVSAGEPERTYQVEPGHPVVHDFALSIPEPGPHSLQLGGRVVCICLEDGVASTCPGACVSPVPPDPADYKTGVMVRSKNANTCDKPIDLYVVPPRDQLSVAEWGLRPIDARVERLEPGETRIIEVDSGLWLANFRDEGGSTAAGVSDEGMSTWSCTGVKTDPDQ